MMWHVIHARGYHRVSAPDNVTAAEMCGLNYSRDSVRVIRASLVPIIYRSRNTGDHLVDFVDENLRLVETADE